MSAHTPGPWSMSRPMGTDHLQGREPWFWVSADTTLHLKVYACPDGFVVGQNEANARLIAAAPELLEALEFCESVIHGDLTTQRAGALQAARAAIARAKGEA